MINIAHGRWPAKKNLNCASSTSNTATTKWTIPMMHTALAKSIAFCNQKSVSITSVRIGVSTIFASQIKSLTMTPVIVTLVPYGRSPPTTLASMFASQISFTIIFWKSAGLAHTIWSMRMENVCIVVGTVSHTTDILRQTACKSALTYTISLTTSEQTVKFWSKPRSWIR